MQPNTRAKSLSPRVSAANLATEREVLDERIPSDLTRPVYSAIRSAFIEQFSVLYVLLTERARNPATEAIPPELVKLDKDCTKLAGLLFSRSNAWAVRDWKKPTQVLVTFRSAQQTRAPSHQTRNRGTGEGTDVGRPETLEVGNTNRQILQLRENRTPDLLPR